MKNFVAAVVPWCLDLADVSSRVLQHWAQEMWLALYPERSKHGEDLKSVASRLFMVSHGRVVNKC